jgi:hypothetical protein
LALREVSPKSINSQLPRLGNSSGLRLEGIKGKLEDMRI